MLTPLIPEFASLYPEIQVELALGEDKVDLRRQGIDIEFRISPPAEAGLKRRKLFESKRLLVASPAYMDSRPAVENPADLLKLDLLAYMRPVTSITGGSAGKTRTTKTATRIWKSRPGTYRTTAWCCWIWRCPGRGWHA